MAVWPFLMVSTTGLFAWGWLRGAWEIPALALGGYVAMRAIVTYVPPNYIEVVGCASWLFFAAIMIARGGAIPGFFYALSALTYPVLLIFGFRLHYMGLSPIIAEAFAVMALLSIGGGIYGVATASPDNPRPLHWIKAHSVGVAAR